MEKSWINLPQNTTEYAKGLEKFLDFAIANRSVDGRIKCPCPNCKFRRWLTRNEVYEHLILKQFPVGYTRWIWHGESSVVDTSNSGCCANEPSTSQSSENSMQNMINDAFGISRHHLYEPNRPLE